MIDNGSYAVGERTDGEWYSEEVPGGKLYHGDCNDGLNTLDDGSITLTFTSPPYFNAINYAEHSEKKLNGSGRWERTDDSYDDYRDFLMTRFETLLEKTKPGGHAIVNISPVNWEGERKPIPFHFVVWMEAIGWKFKEDIVWEKTVTRDRRSGVLMQHPYPGYYYPSCVNEYVFVFQKESNNNGEDNIYHDKSQKQKDQDRIDLSDYNEDGLSKNNWKFRPVSPNANKHPAPFPLDLAERVIKLYSYSDDLVVDIFGGSGQTLLAAQNLDRRFIGFETQSEYVDYSNYRLRTNNELPIVCSTDSIAHDMINQAQKWGKTAIIVNKRSKYGKLTVKFNDDILKGELLEQIDSTVHKVLSQAKDDDSNIASPTYDVKDRRIVVDNILIKYAKTLAEEISGTLD